MLHHQIDVPLGERSYPIYVGSGMTASFATTCRQHETPARIVIITDTNVAKHYLTALERNLQRFNFDVSSIVIPPGERQKSLARANQIFTAMLKEGVGRATAVVALGGGVVGDLAGFVASVYQRGVPFIQAPTTLLSQIDSSVGGKVAVNHPLGKNMIGAFYQPRFVWTDIKCLDTLPVREVSCGLGEIVKYGVIWDEGLFRYLEEHIDRVLRLDRQAVLDVQARCCKIKAHIVSKDERESGLRMVLNFGHTVGHALEAAGRYRLLKHGEAVLLGMTAESFLAMELGLIDRATHDRIASLIRRVPIRQNLSSISPASVLDAMSHDKKSIGRKKRFVLPTRIGEVRIVDAVDHRLVRECLRQIFPGQRRRLA